MFGHTVTGTYAQSLAVVIAELTAQSVFQVPNEWKDAQTRGKENDSEAILGMSSPASSQIYPDQGSGMSASV